MRKRSTRFAQAAGLLLAALGILAAPAGAQEIRLLASKPIESEFDLAWGKTEKAGAVVIAGARTGAFSGKVVLASKQPIAGVSAKASGLKCRGGGSIPASAVEIRYGLYAKSTNCFARALPLGSPCSARVTSGGPGWGRPRPRGWASHCSRCG